MSFIPANESIELRNAIYGLVFTPSKTTADLEALLTCKQMYTEAWSMAFANATFCIDLAKTTSRGDLLQQALELPAEEKAAIARVHLLGPDKYDWTKEPEMCPFENMLIELDVAGIKPTLVGIHTNFSLPRSLNALGFYSIVPTEVKLPWARFLYGYLMHNHEVETLRVIEDVPHKSPIVTISRIAKKASDPATCPRYGSIGLHNFEQDVWTLCQGYDSQEGATIRVWSNACNTKTALRICMSHEHNAASKAHRKQ